MSPCTVRKGNKVFHPVNLGWLMRHAREIAFFVVRKDPVPHLTAHLVGGGTFESEFGDYSVMTSHFLDRRAFNGLTVTEGTDKRTIGEREYQVHGLYVGGWQELTASPTREEALELIRDYKANEPRIMFRLRKVRAAL